MKYVGEWEEIVYDSFNDLECVNPMEEIEVDARSFEDAKIKILDKAALIINENRPDQSSGMFVISILTITDELGQVVRINEPRRV